MRKLKLVRQLFLWITCCVLMPSTGFSQLIVSNNSVWVLFADSYDAAQYGHRFGNYLHSYMALNHPQYNIYWRSASRSGAGAAEMLQNRVEKLGFGHWGYQFNNNQHVMIWLETGNGGYTSNQTYDALSLMIQAPTNVYNGICCYTNEGGWASTNSVQLLLTGEIFENNPAGGNAFVRNSADATFAQNYHVPFADIYKTLSTPWSNCVNGYLPDYIHWFPNGHPGSAGHLMMTYAMLKGWGADTNVALATLDWKSASVSSTNHCKISNLGKSGNTLTFQRLDDRLPFAWDYPNGTITNDASDAFKLMPEIADWMKYSLTITNLPHGSFEIAIDQVTVARVSDTVLSNGWNMFTNVTGPIWNQRVEVLGRIRDQNYVNRISLYDGSAGDGQGIVSYGSYAQLYWATATNRGDRLISLLSIKEANLVNYDAAIRQAAQPVARAFSVRLLPQSPTNLRVVP